MRNWFVRWCPQKTEPASVWLILKRINTFNQRKTKVSTLPHDAREMPLVNDCKESESRWNERHHNNKEI
jgi:hypothetical protein